MDLSGRCGAVFVPECEHPESGTYHKPGTLHCSNDKYVDKSFVTEPYCRKPSLGREQVALPDKIDSELDLESLPILAS